MTIGEAMDGRILYMVKEDKAKPTDICDLLSENLAHPRI